MPDKPSASPPALPPFRERAPWFGGDLQTLRNIIIGGPPELPGGERLLLPMPDGDLLAARLDRPATDTGAPLIVLTHGLAGSESSRHGIATARYLVSQGWPVLRLNLRGAAPSRATSGGRYHAGKTEDLVAALRGLPAELVSRGIVLIGNSLGGNLVLKFVGEGGHGLPVLAAVAVSTPIDLAASCARLMAPRNFVYHRYMLNEMKREALAPSAALTAAERAAIAGARNSLRIRRSLRRAAFRLPGRAGLLRIQRREEFPRRRDAADADPARARRPLGPGGELRGDRLVEFADDRDGVDAGRGTHGLPWRRQPDALA